MSKQYYIILTQLHFSPLYPSVSKEQLSSFGHAGEISDIHYMFAEPTPTPSFQATLSCPPPPPPYASMPPTFSPFRPLMAGCTCTLTPPFTPSTSPSPSLFNHLILVHRQTKVPSQRLALQTALTTIIWLHSPFIITRLSKFCSYQQSDTFLRVPMETVAFWILVLS